MADLHVTVEAIQGNDAVLKNGTVELRLPLQYLPSGVRLGEAIILKTAPAAEVQQDQYENMRRLLEELIN